MYKFSKKRKIIYLSSLYSPFKIGGAEMIVQNIAERAVECGNDVVVVTTSNKPGVSIKCINSVKIYYIGLRNIYWPYSGKKHCSPIRLLWHLIDANNVFMTKIYESIYDYEKPDLIHTHNLTGLSTVAWRIASERAIPIVHTLHDYSLLCPKSTCFNNNMNCKNQCYLCSLLSKTKKNNSNYVNTVVGVSKFVLQRHLDSQYFSTAQLAKVVFNGINEANSFASQSVFAKHKDVIKLGYLGRLEHSKGIESLLSSLERIKHKKWELWIGGTNTNAEYVSDLKAKFESPQVHFMGFVNRDEFFSNVDVLIVPSLWHEPFGLVVLEAFSHNIPVICTNRGALPELVKNGVNGYIYDPDNVQSIINIIDLLIKDVKLLYKLKNNIQKNNIMQSTTTMCSAYFDIYNELICAR